MKLSLIAAALLASTLALCEGHTKMVIGYFPNWLYANYPVESIPFTKYTHINYAFALLNNENNLPSFPDDWAVESSLPTVVKLAHENKTKVLLSVGGWTGSKKFSPMVASRESRQKFIDWNLDFISKYNTDGVDLDWEYPGKQAAGCNEFADNDADNFLLLLKELRQALDAKFTGESRKEISMAVHVQPFVKSGTPMIDLKEFVPYFDHVNLMTYDINGAWASTTGPNAPFRFEQGKGAPFSFVDSIQDWKKAGVPAGKITAGLAFYGRSMKLASSPSLERSQFQDSIVGAPHGDSDDAYWNDPYCNADTGGLSGVWKWTNLRKQGLVGDDFLSTAPGWQRYWDEVSQTPWLLNEETKDFISYDDPQSLDIKVQHALCEDLAGVMVWDIHQDNGELLDVVNRIHNGVSGSCAAPRQLVDIDGDDEEEAIPIIAVDPISHNPLIAVDPVISAKTGFVPIFTLHPPRPTAISLASPGVAGKSPLDGSECPTDGVERCVENGKSAQWLTCNFNSWLVRDCVTGLVCHDAEGGSGIYCDFPAAGALEQPAAPAVQEWFEAAPMAEAAAPMAEAAAPMAEAAAPMAEAAVPMAVKAEVASPIIQEEAPVVFAEASVPIEQEVAPMAAEVAAPIVQEEAPIVFAEASVPIEQEVAPMTAEVAVPIVQEEAPVVLAEASVPIEQEVAPMAAEAAVPIVQEEAPIVFAEASVPIEQEVAPMAAEVAVPIVQEEAPVVLAEASVPIEQEVAPMAAEVAVPIVQEEAPVVFAEASAPIEQEVAPMAAEVESEAPAVQEMAEAEPAAPVVAEQGVAPVVAEEMATPVEVAAEAEAEEMAIEHKVSLQVEEEPNPAVMVVQPI